MADATESQVLGSANVDVFILDTGIDYLNLDLNGLVDQSRSVDLVGTFTIDTFSFTERDTVAKYFPTRQPFTDLFFHGTHDDLGAPGTDPFYGKGRLNVARALGVVP